MRALLKCSLPANVPKYRTQPCPSFFARCSESMTGVCASATGRARRTSEGGLRSSWLSSSRTSLGGGRPHEQAKAAFPCTPAGPIRHLPPPRSGLLNPLPVPHPHRRLPHLLQPKPVLKLLEPVDAPRCPRERLPPRARNRAGHGSDTAWRDARLGQACSPVFGPRGCNQQGLPRSCDGKARAAKLRAAGPGRPLTFSPGSPPCSRPCSPDAA